MKKFLFVFLFLIVGITATHFLTKKKSPVLSSDLTTPNKSNSVISNFLQKRKPSSKKTHTTAKNKSKKQISKTGKLSGKLFKSDSNFQTPYMGYFGTDERVFGNTKFKISQDLNSIPKNEYKSHMGQIILSAYGHVFFQKEGEYGTPALLNTKNHRPTILTGRVTITSNSKLDSETLKLKFGQPVDETMKHLNFYAIKKPKEISIWDFYNNVKAHPELIVELEMLQGVPSEK